MKLRDYDSGEQGQRIQLLLWSIVGAIFGVAIALMLQPLTGLKTFPSVAIGALGGGGGIYFLSVALGHAAGNAAASVFAPSGSSTPSLRSYSHAESLVARGRYDEAIDAYRQHATAGEQDAEAAVRIARIYRDQLKRNEDAITWFRGALNRARQPAHEIAIAREFSELLIHRINEPRRALPVLARIAEKYPNEPAGRWAREQLTEIKGC